MSLLRSFATVASNTLVSRILGFARDILIASTLGAGTVADAFFAAFKLPNLFRRLFAGRPDVFPVRWENRKTGRSGYSPACANEWVKGICGKPKVKCGECPNQKFIPPNEGVIVRHLRGDDGRSALQAALRLAERAPRQPGLASPSVMPARRQGRARCGVIG